MLLTRRSGGRRSADFGRSPVRSGANFRRRHHARAANDADVSRLRPERRSRIWTECRNLHDFETMFPSSGLAKRGVPEIWPMGSHVAVPLAVRAGRADAADFLFVAGRHDSAHHSSALSIEFLWQFGRSRDLERGLPSIPDVRKSPARHYDH